MATHRNLVCFYQRFGWIYFRQHTLPDYTVLSLLPWRKRQIFPITPKYKASIFFPLKDTRRIIFPF
jgi:DNA-binding PucR family transcriptional regulator